MDFKHIASTHPQKLTHSLTTSIHHEADWQTLGFLHLSKEHANVKACLEKEMKTCYKNT